jgi:hypothetical protein
VPFGAESEFLAAWARVGGVADPAVRGCAERGLSPPFPVDLTAAAGTGFSDGPFAVVPALVLAGARAAEGAAAVSRDPEFLAAAALFAADVLAGALLLAGVLLAVVTFPADVFGADPVLGADPRAGLLAAAPLDTVVPAGPEEPLAAGAVALSASAAAVMGVKLRNRMNC